MKTTAQNKTIMAPTARVSSDSQWQINNSSDDHAIIINNGSFWPSFPFTHSEQNGGKPLGY